MCDEQVGGGGTGVRMVKGTGAPRGVGRSIRWRKASMCDAMREVQEDGRTNRAGQAEQTQP